MIAILIGGTMILAGLTLGAYTINLYLEQKEQDKWNNE